MGARHSNDSRGRAEELNSNEKSYVDGGGAIPTWMVSASLDIAFMLCGLGFDFTPIKLFGKTFGKKMATRFIQNKGWFIADILVDVMRTISGGAINIAVGSLMNNITNYFWSFTSLGGIVAFAADIATDGRVDGRISW